MTRPTSDVRTATRRLAEFLGYGLDTQGRLWTLHRPWPRNTTPLRKPPAVLLAFLADTARQSMRHGGHGLTTEQVRDVIQWKGPIPSRGLAGWQEQTLSTLTLESER